MSSEILIIALLQAIVTILLIINSRKAKKYKALYEILLNGYKQRLIKTAMKEGEL